MAIVFWGASFVFTRMALQSFSPFGLVSVRLLVGALLLVVLAGTRGGPLWPVRRDAAACVFLGVFLAGHLLIQAYGLQYTSAINTGWIIGFIPVTIALGAHFLGRQRLGRIGWIGVALGAGGVLIVTLRSPPDFAQARLGDLLQMSSCLTWTVYTLAGTGPVERNGALRVTASAMMVAAGLATAATIRTGVTHSPLTPQSLTAVIFLGPLCSGVAYLLWFAAIRERGAARVGALLYLEPFVTLATAAAILAEPVTINALVGGVCVLAGVWYVAKGSRLPGGALRQLPPTEGRSP